MMQRYDTEIRDRTGGCRSKRAMSLKPKCITGRCRLQPVRRNDAATQVTYPMSVNAISVRFEDQN